MQVDLLRRAVAWKLRALVGDLVRIPAERRDLVVAGLSALADALAGEEAPACCPRDDVKLRNAW